jgi:oligopeptide/dipeptide ABC transporter ATP-binding protein
MLVEVKNLKKYFQVRAGLFRRVTGLVHAVDSVTFGINEKETFALIGESGCGKTTLGRTVLRLIEPTSGEIYLEGKNILELTKDQLRSLRQKMQIVFQDPASSLNPRVTVGKAVSEPLIINKLSGSEEARERTVELFKKVGLEEGHFDKFPHEFSGGQKQRVCIARALILKPKFLVLDEPTSALDVSVQAQILNLLMELQEEYSLTYLFISHNLSIVRNIADRIGVMYAGKLVETGTARKIFSAPLNPYTKALFSAVPIAKPGAKREIILLEGEPPSLISPPQGCRFWPRCKFAKNICKESEPNLKVVENGHEVACWLAQ